MAPHATLEALNLRSYEELHQLPVGEIIANLHRVPLHDGDAFLAVLAVRALSELSDTTAAVGRAVDELHRTTAAIDRASRRLEVAALIVGIVAVVVGIGGIVATLAA
ncbi:hypothetical protein [Conexibacter arvalis]|uniref:Uncharacterized protein n=1 Tax=Conexibacter arvalis TaxID=912552 RepID=A0A840IG37_9ACTN|nr:hypothetical protein [Conexibacter arvalis]MBB4663024.1 hypothetical protein [Conexibacter arvalis]